eukprot:jgi/Mesvir1/10005/Mv05797-RA.1
MENRRLTIDMDSALTLAGVTTMLVSAALLLLLMSPPRPETATEDDAGPSEAAAAPPTPDAPETAERCGSDTASMLTLLEDSLCAQKGQGGRVAEIGWSKTLAYGVAVGVADYYNPLGILSVATGSLFKPNAVSNWFDRVASDVNATFGDVAIGKRGPLLSPFHLTKIALNCEKRGKACERLEKLDKAWQYIPVNFAMMKTVGLVHKLNDRAGKLKIKGKSIAQMQLTAVAGVGAFATAYVTELIQIVTFKKVSLVPVVSMYLAGLRAAFDVIDDLFPWLKFATKALAWLEKGFNKATCKVVALFGAKPDMCKINRPPFLQAYHDTLAKEAGRRKKIADAPDATVQQKDEYHEFERLRWVVYDRIKKYFQTNEDAVTVSFMFDVVAKLSPNESEEFYQKIAHDPQNWVKANPKNEEAFMKWAMDDASIKSWIERLKTDAEKAAEVPIEQNTTYQF